MPEILRTTKRTAPPKTMRPATRLLRRVPDAIGFATVVVTGVVSRRPVRPIADEGRRVLPGDSLLPQAKDRWTHAVTIRARPSEIWPWLVQMGCRRAGWYSYDGLDNGAVPSAERIVPALQQIEVGDLMAWTPRANDGFFVAEIDPERALILRGDAGGLYRVTWAFVLEPIDSNRTRLLARASGDYERRAVGLMLKLVGQPLHFAMQRKQLLNLRDRIETAAALRIGRTTRGPDERRERRHVERVGRLTLPSSGSPISRPADHEIREGASR